jgi:uncharacterized protein YjiS (DUF1127 family)
MPTTFSLKPSLAILVGRLLQDLAERARRARAEWQRRRDLNATFAALDRLDAHLLHDLGLDRSELSSAAAELYGAALPQRKPVLHSLRAAR